MRKKQELQARFWSKVDVQDNHACWNWLAATFTNGYGAFGVTSGKMKTAHRVSYELVHGKIPEGMVVMHTCDNPLCVNPSHLVVGTYQDNTNDMVSKSRQAKGEKHGRAKLTENDVLRIYDMVREGGLSQEYIAGLFNISRMLVSCIKHKQLWKHLLADID